jgi:hypothetical protein
VSFAVDEDDYADFLMHYGTPRHSGRYPWGSGGEGSSHRNQDFLSTVDQLKRKGLSDTEIARQLEREGKPYLDIGSGQEFHAAVSRSKFDNAVAVLKEKGYVTHNVQVPQLGTPNMTTIKVLAKPGTTYRDIKMNMEGIGGLSEYSNDGGRSFLGLQPPLSISSKRIAIRYAEDGGGKADGVLYVRPGKEDLSLGGKNYAQVRVAVDGTH